MNIPDYYLNWVLNWIIFRPGSKKKCIFKADRPGLCLGGCLCYMGTKTFALSIKNFCPQTTKFCPKLAFLVILGQALLAYLVPCWWVGWLLWRVGWARQLRHLFTLLQVEFALANPMNQEERIWTKMNNQTGVRESVSDKHSQWSDSGQIKRWWKGLQKHPPMNS